VRWYESQLLQKRVRIELNKEVPENPVVRFLYDEEKPDALILGTGSTARKDASRW
jgi:hypothetical protein